MTEEPVFRDREAGMGFECLDQQLSVPYADCSMRKCSGTNFSGKGSLYTADFVLDILSLLAQSASAAVWPHALYCITNTFDA